jgi:hypothetical protein
LAISSAGYQASPNSTRNEVSAGCCVTATGRPYARAVNTA